MVATIGCALMVASSGCSKAKPPTPFGPRANRTPLAPVTSPSPAARAVAFDGLDPVWIQRTWIANMYDGKFCLVRNRVAGATGPTTLANSRPMYIRLGNRSGSQGPDADRDGVSDVAERRVGTDPNNADTDGDTIPDGFEFFGSGTNPLSADSNGNGTPDNVEFNLDDPNEYADSDGDQLLNGQERAYTNSNPESINSDGDMASDDTEFLLGTNMMMADADSDGDGEPDAFESANGTDPMNAGSELTDSDGDGLPNFLDPDDLETARVLRDRPNDAVPAGGVEAFGNPGTMG